MKAKQKMSAIMSVVSDMQQLAEVNFLKTFNISYFSYTKVNKNRTFSTLTSDALWTENFYANKYYNIGIDSLVPGVNFSNHFKVIAWEIIERDKNHDTILTDLRNYSIFNLFTLIKMTENETHLYHFGSRKEELFQNQIYFEHQDLLKIFTYYFQEQLHKSKTLSAAAQSDFFLGKVKSQDSLSERLFESTTQNPFLNIDRYYLNDACYITKREIECLQWVALGKTTENTGEIMHISSRTVETHINNLKQKLRCNKITSALHLLMRLGLIS